MGSEQPLIDHIYRDKVSRARMMSPDEKFDAGYTLFEQACEVTRAGIRFQHPEANEQEVERILEKRLAIRAMLDNQSRDSRSRTYGI